MLSSPPVSPAPRIIMAKKNVRKHDDTTSSSDDDDEIHEPKVEGVGGTSTGIKSELRKIPDRLFKREASTRYFQQSTKEVPDMGARMIVAEAVFNNTSFSSSLQEKDVQMIMNMSAFADTLTRAQREQLATVLDDSVNATKRQLGVDSSSTGTDPNAVPTAGTIDSKPPAKRHKSGEERQPDQKLPAQQHAIPVPTTKESIRSIFMEGKRSIKENLPHPFIYQDVVGHSYLLPSECIVDCMAHGILDQNITGKTSTYQHLPESKLAHELAERDPSTRTIYLSLWCDDFEPNYSTKAGRGAVWILTLTLESKESGPAGVSHVYPIAVGLKGKDHNVVLRKIWDDLREIRNGLEVFNGYKDATEKVRGEVVAWTMDQPELRGCNGLLLGGSTSHARFGYAVDISQLEEKMRPCRRCLSHMISTPNEWEDRDHCNLCYNWMAHGTMEYNAPDGFPLNEEKLKPVRLTYEFLKKTVQEVHDKLVNGDWTTTQATTYLKTYGLNLASIEGITTCANNIRAYNQAKEKLATEDNEANRALVESFEEDRVLSPEKHQAWQYPAIWDSDLDLHVHCHQAGMHLLFLGIAKTMVWVIQAWATGRKKYTTLQKSIKQSSTRLEALKLSWLKIQAYQGPKLGGWVSENFMAFAHVLPWLYSSIEDLPDDDTYVLPTRPRKEWNMDENRAWLRSRNLPTDGNADTLKLRVKDNWSLPEAKNIGGLLANVRKVIVSEWFMISYLMGMKGSSDKEVNEASRLIRLFLTHLYDHEASMGQGKQTWLSSYNFVCLLNLPEQINKLGPIRNRWEGGARGEGFLRTVKPMTPGTTRLHWQRHLLTNLIKHKSNVLICGKGKSTYKQAGSGNIDFSSIKLYSSMTEFMRQWASSQPISVFVGKSEAEGMCPPLYSMIKEGSERKYVQISPVEPATKGTYNGQTYHRFEYSEVAIGIDVEDLHVEMYAVLLPMLIDMFDDYKMFTVITDQWTVLDGSFNNILPHYMKREVFRATQED